MTIATTEGQFLNNVVVATFNETDLGNTTTDFTASINWGDSTTSIGTIQSNGGATAITSWAATPTPRPGPTLSM